jgi:NADH-quinone oxidoreductase subunit M
MKLTHLNAFANAERVLGLPFNLLFWVLLFIGFAIKIPMFPFHTWLPDAHVDAPTPISVILAGVLLKMGTYGIFRINYQLLPEATQYWAKWMAVFGVINILYGALCAMAQKDLKKLVAYSSVSHMGFCLLGMAAVTDAGMMGSMFQMFNHGTITSMLFLLVGVIYDRAHHRDLNGFGGLAQPMPVYWGLTTIGFFAALGLPGMAGFVSEALTLVGSFRSEDTRFQVLVLISVIGIVITAAFLLWAMQRVFLGPLNEKYKDYKDINLREIFCQAPLLFLCIALGIFPYFLLDWMAPSVETMVNVLRSTAG